MATFSSLPTELLQQVSYHLAPFDQVALSTTSKSFYAIIKPHKPLDEVALHIVLSLNMTTANLPASNIVHHPNKVRVLLFKIFRSLPTSPWVSDLPANIYGGLSGNYGPRPASQSEIHELLEPYFMDKDFPQYTIAYYYFSAIKTFAKRVCEYGFGNELEELKGWWGYVMDDAEKGLRWLEEDLTETAVFRLLQSERAFGESLQASSKENM